MNLKQLEAFVEVAEGGSFSKAAKESVPDTADDQCAYLCAWEELEVRLFVRNTKEVSLSAEGQTLYRYASQMVDLEETDWGRIWRTQENGAPVYYHCGIYDSITVSASEDSYQI